MVQPSSPAISTTRRSTSPPDGVTNEKKPSEAPTMMNTSPQSWFTTAAIIKYRKKKQPIQALGSEP